MGTAQEEADESAFWLELVIEGQFVKESLVGPLLNEATELTKIVAKSRISASQKLRKKLSIVNRQ